MLEHWLEKTVPRSLAVSLSREKCDPFCNPVEFALRGSLAMLLDQLFGEWRPETVKVALAEIMRIRAVQDGTGSEAVEFVSQLRPLLGESDAVQQEIDARIDQMASLAFAAYARCREQIAELRISENRRRLFVPSARRGSAREEQASKRRVTRA